MNIKVLFFGKVREIVKENSINIEIPDDYTLKNVVNNINAQHQILAEIPIVYSKNNEYMYSLDVSLNNGDTIGFIPPISGG